MNSTSPGKTWASLRTGFLAVTVGLAVCSLSAAAPSNDYFTNASPSFARISVAGATLEPGEPDHCDGAPCKSLWWNIQIRAHGSYGFISDTNLASNVVLAVYTGDALGALSLVKKGYNSLSLGRLDGGTVLRLAVVVPADFDGEVSIAGTSTILYGEYHPVPYNLLFDGSFEDPGYPLQQWAVSRGHGGAFNERFGAADGRSWLTIPPGGKLWQDFATVTGRTYEVRFAYGQGIPCWVLADAAVLGTIEAPLGGWNWTNLFFTATSSVTRLMLTNGITPFFWENGELRETIGFHLPLDAFSAAWAHEPPSLVAEPASVSTLPGGGATFLPVARGRPPLSYQWRFNGAPIPGQTQLTLSLAHILPENAGGYSVVVTNYYGSVTSAPAALTVESTPYPVILVHPFSDTVPAGGYFTLYTVAVGAAPLSYQWDRDGVAVPGATNAQLIFDSIQTTNAGTYTVRVANGSGSALGLPATLIVATDLPGGGYVQLGNRILVGPQIIDAPVYDVDGTTRLNTSNYVAQLYAGPTLELLRPAGSPTPFRTQTTLAGYFRTQTVPIGNVPPYALAVVQVRAWDSDRGATYETARAYGGKTGKSGVLQITALLPPPYLPANLNGLQSFSLRAGSPFFNVGTIRLLDQLPNGPIIWALDGQAGNRYLVERATNGLAWHPIFVLTNTTGTVTFTDPSAPGSGAFYRSRILD